MSYLALLQLVLKYSSTRVLENSRMTLHTNVRRKNEGESSQPCNDLLSTSSFLLLKTKLASSFQCFSISL